MKTPLLLLFLATPTAALTQADANCSKFPQGGGMGCRTFEKTPGESQKIAMVAFHEYCGDVEGCRLRLFSILADGGAEAAAETVFFIPGDNQGWAAGPDSGVDGNGDPEIILAAGKCYLTDGLVFLNGTEEDGAEEFSLYHEMEKEPKHKCQLGVLD